MKLISRKGWVWALDWGTSEIKASVSHSVFWPQSPLLFAGAKLPQLLSHANKGPPCKWPPPPPKAHQMLPDVNKGITHIKISHTVILFSTQLSSDYKFDSNKWDSCVSLFSSWCHSLSFIFFSFSIWTFWSP